MSRRMSRLVDATVESHGLDGYARERVEEVLSSDETLAALLDVEWIADREQEERRPDVDEVSETHERLVDARDSAAEAALALRDDLVRETVEDVEVHGHSVNLTHSRRLDCPSCSEERIEAFYLGTRGTLVGWVCGFCGAVVETDPAADQDEPVVVEEGDA
jgi:hypothetical protein